MVTVPGRPWLITIIVVQIGRFVGSSMVMIGVDFTAHSDEMIQNGSVYSCVIVVVMCILVRPHFSYATSRT